MNNLHCKIYSNRKQILLFYHTFDRINEICLGEQRISKSLKNIFPKSSFSLYCTNPKVYLSYKTHIASFFPVLTLSLESHFIIHYREMFAENTMYCTSF